MNLDAFIDYVFPLFVLILGLVGNTFSFIIFGRKEVKNITSANIYKGLALLDTLYLTSRIVQKLLFNLGYDLKNSSLIGCKLVIYFNPALGPMSAWLLVYISIERFFAIRCPKINFIRSLSFEIFIMVTVIVYNMLFYLPFPLLHDFKLNLTQNSTRISGCLFKSKSIARVLLTLDMFNLSLIPFALMIFFSLMLIGTVFQSRLKTSKSNVSKRDKSKLRKDIHFAFASIVLNVSFILFNLPFCLSNILRSVYPDQPAYLLELVEYLYLSSYGNNFYVLIVSNSIIQKEFLSLFRPRVVLIKTSTSKFS